MPPEYAQAQPKHLTKPDEPVQDGKAQRALERVADVLAEIAVSSFAEGGVNSETDQQAE